MFTSLFLKMLNRHAASRKNHPDRILESLRIQEGYRIADIGSGGGYFTLKFAKKVGKIGKVYAVDSQPKYLNFIRQQAEREGLDNIVFVSATEDEVNLPEPALDLVFARNVFHHLTEPAKYFRNLNRFLKPTGKVAVIDHKPKSGFSFVSIFRHYTPEGTILQEMEKAGYFLMESFDFLPEHTFVLFGLK